MCLSLPAKVLTVEGDMAEVSVGGAVFRAGVQMVEDLRPGDYILLHAGFAIGKMKEVEALETIRLLEEINGAGPGAGNTANADGTDGTDETYVADRKNGPNNSDGTDVTKEMSGTGGPDGKDGMDKRGGEL